MTFQHFIAVQQVTIIIPQLVQILTLLEIEAGVGGKGEGRGRGGTVIACFQSTKSIQTIADLSTINYTDHCQSQYRFWGAVVGIK